MPGTAADGMYLFADGTEVPRRISHQRPLRQIDILELDGLLQDPADGQSKQSTDCTVGLAARVPVPINTPRSKKKNGGKGRPQEQPNPDRTGVPPSTAFFNKVSLGSGAQRPTRADAVRIPDPRPLNIARRRCTAAGDEGTESGLNNLNGSRERETGISGEKKEWCWGTMTVTADSRLNRVPPRWSTQKSPRSTDVSVDAVSNAKNWLDNGGTEKSCRGVRTKENKCQIPSRDVKSERETAARV
ncbi:hypothetical protein C8F01DRAFT_1084127 [Mycena amicta]|nr:hypothetical protein C8F01DRAFT_1084127 [Mycena amicta]